MSLLGAICLILNGRAQSDIDMQGYKLLNLDTSNLGEFNDQAPFSDANALIKGSVDATKLARFEVDGFTAATTRVFTLPNYNATLASLAGAEAFTNKTSYNGLTLSGSGGGIELNSGIISLSDSTLVLDGDVTVSGSGASLTFQLSGNTNLILPTVGTVAVTSQIPTISDVAYNEATWNGNLDGATKNAIRDKFENLEATKYAPLVDTQPIVKGSVDATKLFRFEVDGFTTGVTRVMTPPNYNFTPASIAGEESLIKKTVNGLIVAVGDAASAGGAITYVEAPASAFLLNLVAISQSGTVATLRTTAPTDIVLPTTGVVATVALTIPLSYLDAKPDLGAGAASDIKVSSQKAVKAYVDAHVGAGKDPVSGDTVASATSVDLSATTDYQLDVSGMDDIEAFVLDEDDERVLVFEDTLILVQGSFLLLPGGIDIETQAGGFAIVRGRSGGVVEVVRYQNAQSSIIDAEGGKIDSVFITNSEITSTGVFGIQSTGAVFDLRIRSIEVITANRILTINVQDANRGIALNGDLVLGGAFTTSGASALTLTTTGVTNVTLPTSGLLGSLVAVPASSISAGTDGQWARDGAFLYVYNSAELVDKWGRTALTYSW